MVFGLRTRHNNNNCDEHYIEGKYNNRKLQHKLVVSALARNEPDDVQYDNEIYIIIWQKNMKGEKKKDEPNGDETRFSDARTTLMSKKSMQ